VEDRLESSDDDEYQDERAGMLSASYDNIHHLARLPGLRSLHDAWKTNSLRVRTPRRSKFYVSTPPPQNSQDSSRLRLDTHTHTHIHTHSHDRTAGQCTDDGVVAPDLVRDLLVAPPPAPESPQRISLRQLLHGPSLKSRIWRRSQRNCHSLQPNIRLNPPERLRPTPIIVVENYDVRRVQQLRTDLILHPQTSRASVGHIEVAGSEQLLAKKANYWQRHWHLLRHKASRSESSHPHPLRETGNSHSNNSTPDHTANCNDCVAQ